mgnify:CR=1 FL=1
MIQASTLQFLKTIKKNNNKEWFNKNNKYFKAISPNGEEFTSNRPVTFAKQHNLTSIGIHDCLKGKQHIHRNWKFKYI